MTDTETGSTETAKERTTRLMRNLFVKWCEEKGFTPNNERWEAFDVGFRYGLRAGIDITTDASVGVFQKMLKL